MIRGKLLTRYSTLAVRALVTAGVVERGWASSQCFHSPRCLHCATDTSIPTASVHVKDVHASCCGFPKHLKNGPSTVLDQGVFGDDACFIAQFGSTHVVGKLILFTKLRTSSTYRSLKEAEALISSPNESALPA